jgi:hypothetical protein
VLPVIDSLADRLVARVGEAENNKENGEDRDLADGSDGQVASILA